MNRQFMLALLVALTGILLTNSACKKDADRDQFISAYDVSQDCSGQASNYQIDIRASGDGEKVSIDNFANLGFLVAGTCAGDQLLFDQQTGVSRVDGVEVVFTITQGAGTLSGSTLTVPFSFTGTNGWTGTCTMTCSKR